MADQQRLHFLIGATLGVRAENADRAYEAARDALRDLQSETVMAAWTDPAVRLFDPAAFEHLRGQLAMETDS